MAFIQKGFPAFLLRLRAELVMDLIIEWDDWDQCGRWTFVESYRKCCTIPAVNQLNSNYGAFLGLWVMAFEKTGWNSVKSDCPKMSLRMNLLPGRYWFAWNGKIASWVFEGNWVLMPFWSQSEENAIRVKYSHLNKLKLTLSFSFKSLDRVSGYTVEQIYCCGCKKHIYLDENCTRGP